MSNVKTTERQLVLVVALLQFVNIIDFMMIMPLGPDLSESLGIAVDQIGLIAGAYTFSAAIMGLLLARTLDRFERKPLLIFGSVGLALATGLAALSGSMTELIGARLLAGLFGGMSTALGMALISDVIPSERRARALAWIMSAFSVASIIGVPFGLEIALRWTWQTPFMVLCGLGLGVAALAWRYIPQIPQKPVKASYRLVELLTRKVFWQGYLSVASVMLLGFLFIPHIASYVVLNLNFPREDIGLLYLVGGLASFVVLRLVGKLVDAKGVMIASIIGTIILATTVIFGFGSSAWQLSAWWIFILFMVGMNFRGVANQTMVSKIPPPAMRAGYMSIQLSIQHISTTLGALISTAVLAVDQMGRLTGFEALIGFACFLLLLQPALIIFLRRSDKVYEKIL